MRKTLHVTIEEEDNDLKLNVKHRTGRQWETINEITESDAKSIYRLLTNEPINKQ